MRRYVVVEDHQALAVALWAVFTWCHEVAVHSPLLVVTSPEQDSGKTTCVNVIGFLVPRPLQLLETSAASVYSLIDATRPTIIHDEADTILERKTDLRHIILGGWTRGCHDSAQAWSGDLPIQDLLSQGHRVKVQGRQAGAA